MLINFYFKVLMISIALAAIIVSLSNISRRSVVLSYRWLQKNLFSKIRYQILYMAEMESFLGDLRHLKRTVEVIRRTPFGSEVLDRGAEGR